MITTYLSALMIHLSCFMNSVLIGFPIIFVPDLGPQAGLIAFYRYYPNFTRVKILPRAADRVFFSLCAAVWAAVASRCVVNQKYTPHLTNSDAYTVSSQLFLAARFVGISSGF